MEVIDQTREISIRDIFSILRTRFLYLIIIPLFILIITFLYLAFQQDYYTAETKLYVLMDYTDSTGQIRYDTNVSAQFAGDFKELIQTPQVIEAAENALGEAFDLGRDVVFDISAVPGTRILNVSATSKYPAMSMLAANTISQVFVDYITEITKIETITIASEAILPDTPSGPERLKTIAIVFGLSIFLLAVFFVALELLNTTLRSSQDVEEALGLTVLGNIADYRKNMKRNFGDGKHLLNDIVSSITRESVKTLATNIEFVFAGRPMQTLMITSTISTEGKSTLTVLLAEALANDGYRVLIVDTDFRKPSIGKLLGTRHKYDLIDYIFNKAKLNEIIVHTKDENIDYTDYVHDFASTSHIYNYKEFGQLVEEAKQLYDVILFDTPPLGLFIDAAILSNMVDGTLLVVGQGLAKGENVKEVIDQLYKAKANIIGAALNFVNLRKGTKYYSYKYYKHYNTDDETK